jgi:hypothetical protein
MLPIFLYSISSTDFQITSPNITTVILGDSDRLFVDGTFRLIYIRVNPHFISGNLSVIIFRPRQPNETIILNPGDRYSFYYANLTFTYRDAWSPCQLSLWVLGSQWCHFGIHVHGQRSAEIHLNGSLIPSKLCYFFEFEKPPTAKINARNVSVLLGFSGGNRTISGEDSFTVDDSMFVLSHDPSGVPFDAEFTTESAISDWDDPPGVFLFCQLAGNCTQAPDYFGVTARGGMTPWAAIIISLPPMVLIGMIAIAMFWWPLGPQLFANSQLNTCLITSESKYG